MNTRLVTAPVIDPVTLDYVKKHTRIDYDVQDLLLSLWVKSATEQIEYITGMSLITQTREVSFDVGEFGYPSTPILVPRSPIQSVSSVKIYDTASIETVLPLTYFDIDAHSIPGRIDLVYGMVWPSTLLRCIRSIVITYVSGFGDTCETVPPDLRDVILLYCTHRNENRSDESGDCQGFLNMILRKRLYVR
jgi:uncharacterized phiE125 gp8 family phage protein